MGFGTADGGGSDAEEGIATMRGRDYPSIRQFSIFAPNNLGQLQTLTRLLETARLQICALSVIDTVECAIIRIIVSNPERAYEVLERGKYRFIEVDMLVVEVPEGQYPMLSLCNTLLRAEVNIHYTYPVMVRASGRTAMAFHVDTIDTATKVLMSAGFQVLTESCLEGIDE